LTHLIHSHFSSKLLLVVIGVTLLACSTTNRISEPGATVKIYPIGLNGLWGYADEQGEIIINYQYDSAQFFTSGLAAVEIKGKYGFINRLGEFEVKPKYDSIINGYGYDAALVSNNGKSYWINRQGKKLKNHKGINLICGTGEMEAADPAVHFDIKKGKYYLKESEFIQQQRLNPHANFSMVDFTFDEVLEFSPESLIVRKGNKFNIYIPFDGVGLKEEWFDEIIPHYSLSSRTHIKQSAATTARVRKGNKWGVISYRGELFIEPEFITMKPSVGIFYLVEYQPGHWGHITFKNRYF